MSLLGKLVEYGALLRAERADARSVDNRCGFKRPCIGRRSGAALRLGLRARPSSDLNDQTGGQFFVSPGGQFRMSFDTRHDEIHKRAHLVTLDS
jgi:hypothetical protein